MPVIQIRCYVHNRHNSANQIHSMIGWAPKQITFNLLVLDIPSFPFLRFVWGVSPSPACIKLVHMDVGKLVGKGEVLQILQNAQSRSYVSQGTLDFIFMRIVYWLGNDDEVTVLIQLTDQNSLYLENTPSIWPPNEQSKRISRVTVMALYIGRFQNSRTTEKNSHDRRTFLMPNTSSSFSVSPSTTFSKGEGRG